MVRWNAGTEHVKTQRQEAPSQGPVARNQSFTADENPVFGQEASCSGATVPQLFPNYFLVFPYLPTFSHMDVYARLGTIMVTAFGRPLT